MKRNIKDYLIDIIDECNYLIKRADKLDYNEFILNEDLTKAFIRSLEVIGEAVKKVPEEIRKQYCQVPWRDISGMRDKLIHEYFGVDYEVIWKTVEEEIPNLKLIIEEIFNNLINI